jgi:hypothetical protein
MRDYPVFLFIKYSLLVLLMAWGAYRILTFDLWGDKK